MNNLGPKFLRFHRLAGMAALLAVLAVPPAGAQEQDAAPAAPRPAKVIEVMNNVIGLNRQYPAIVYPSQEAELSFRVSGLVISLPVRAATRVSKGDVIAELDKREFEATLAQLESQRDKANAELAALRKGARDEEILALEAAVYAAQAKVDQAREQAARTRELFQKEIVAKAQLEKDEALLRVAQAELRTTQEQLAIGRSGGRQEDIDAAEATVRGLEANVEQARIDLSNATLRAPFDGVVARRDIDNYTNIVAGQSIVLLQNLSTIELVFDVPSSDVLEISEQDHENLEVEVSLTGSNRPITASELVEFATQADAGTQTYRARVAVDVPDEVPVLPGMVGRVRVKAKYIGDTLPVVPVTALASESDGATFVWVVDTDSNTIAARPVKTGVMSGDKVSIEDGLEAGETVVVAGVSRLSEGMVIRPITKVGK